LEGISSILLLGNGSPASVTFRFIPASLPQSENIILLNKLNEQILLDLSDAFVIAPPLGLKLINENSYNYISFQPYRYGQGMLYFKAV
jgi:hypothetical protein